MVVVLEVDRAGEETTGTGGTDSTRIGQDMASQAASHTHTLTTHHHHHQGGTGVVGVVPGSRDRDIGDVTIGIAMKDTEEETMGDTMVGTGDMDTKMVVIVLKFEICQQ